MLVVKNQETFNNILSKSAQNRLIQFSKTRFGYRKRMRNCDLLSLYAIFNVGSPSMYNGLQNLTYCRYRECLFSYDTKISYKTIENNIEIVNIYNYTRKLKGAFISFTTSKIINMLIKICVEHQIPYKIIYEEDLLNDFIVDCETEEDCPICLGVNCDIKLKVCGHKFHKKCIMKWCKHKKNCPYCRTPIVSTSIIHETSIYETEPTDDLTLTEIFL
tara:strand:- start:60 stop:710 length:651 start_codon:yes stop_codon:yes gene_type:complete